MNEASSVTPEQRRRNVRLGLVLASIAVALFIGFIVRSAFLHG